MQAVLIMLASTAVDGSERVTSWRDKSGNANDAVVSATLTPDLAGLLRASHGLAVPSHQGAPTVSLQRQHRRQRRALSLRRDTWPRDARLNGIRPAHEARHPARGSLRAQRGPSDLDCAQTAARPRVLNDGLWLRAANFGGDTAQDQRHRPRPYAVASTRRQGRQGTRSAAKRAFAQRVSELLASATSG